MYDLTTTFLMEKVETALQNRAKGFIEMNIMECAEESTVNP